MAGEIPISTEPSSPSPPDRLAAVQSRFESIVLRRGLIIGGLIVLVMIGLFLSNFAVQKAHWYWGAMFPVFGIVSIWNELAGGAAHERPLWKILLRETAHWLFPIIAVRILFLQHERGQMSSDSVALVIVIVLAVTCFLAGVHFDHSFIWVSLVLTAAALLGTEIETYIWMVALLGVGALVLAVVSTMMLRRPKAAPTPSG